MGKFLRLAVLIGAQIVFVVVLSPSASEATNATRVVVGPGNAEDSVRGVVRTAGNVVYIFAPDDTAQRQNAGPGVIRAWKGNVAGNPTAFGEMDAAHHPSSTGTTHTMYAPDVRLDRNGVAKMVYVDQATTNLYYNTFSTVTNTWGTPVQLGTGSFPNPGFYSQPNRVYRNWASYGLTLDASDQPHVVYCSGNNVYSRDDVSGTWTAPQLVATGTSPLHVQLAMAQGNTWVAWMDNPVGPTGSTSIRAAERSAATGAWGPVQVVDSGSPNVLSGQTDDQGPSIIVNSSSVPYVMYLSGTYNSAGQAVSTASIKYFSNGSWVSNNPPSSAYRITHSPQIYGAGGDLYFFLGHDVNIYFGYMYQLAGQPWSPYTVLDSTTKMDGSTSVRWDPARDNNPSVIDVIYHAEDYLADKTYLAQLYYQAVPSSSVTDTAPPTVSLTAPANGSTVSGSVAVSATASDNVAVASVRFQVDGVTLAAVTAPPYQATWNSTTVVNGGHVLTAVATDTSGNAASSQASVTVSNTAPPPSVTSTWPAAGATGQGSMVVPTAVFSASVDASTVSTSTFTLTGPSGVVAGSVSYNSSSFAATLTPSQPLQPGASYTALISGVRGVDGSTVASASWSFTTANCPCSLMTLLSPTAVHLSTTDGRTGTGPFSYELGTKVQVSSPTRLTAIRFYKDSQETGSHTGKVWSSSGSLLAQTTFSGESASGWQSQALSTPLTLQPAQRYVVSVNVNAHFVETPAGLASQLSNPPLQSIVGSNGVYGSSAGTFPSSTYNNTNYFVDPVVDGSTVQPLQVNSTTPGSGATNVDSVTPVTATFSQAIDTTTLNGSTFTLSTSAGAVTGSMSYDSTSQTARFTPSQPLQPGTTYTATISGVVAASGARLSSPVTWSFTTASCPCSLFSPATTPASIHLPVRDARSGTGPWSYELGVKIQVTSAARLTAIGFYKDSQETGTHIGKVWTSSGTLIAQVTFTNETASGWQQQALSSPLTLQAGSTYVISFNDNAYFVDTVSGLASEITNGPLYSVATSNGVYGSSAGTFPNQSYKSSNYFIDLVVDG
jgi:hypothetical protein